MKKILKMLFHILNIILIWLTIVLAIVSIFKKEWIEIAIEWMKVLIDWMWYFNYIIAGLSSFIEAFPVLWVIVPGQNILLIVWWFFWNISYSNLYWVIIVACIGAIFGNYIWYLLWKHYWDSFFKKYWLWFWIWLTEVKYLKKWIKKYWAFWIIFWKFHPMTRAFLPFIAWSMWMHSVSFMIYNIIWSIIRAVTIVLLWVVFVEYYKIILEYVWEFIFILFFFVWIYIYLFKKKEFLQYLKEKDLEMQDIWKK